MGMPIDPSGNQDLAVGVNDFFPLFWGLILPHRGDPFSDGAHIPFGFLVFPHYKAPFDKGLHRRSFIRFQ